MIDKILWASDGSKDSVEALRYAELLATRFKAKIFGLYVIPDYYELAERLPSDKKDRFTEWVEETKSKERESLGQIARNFKEKGTGFDLEITVGIPHKEILRVAERERVDLIAMGKGRPVEKSILGGTALKVLRQSSFPVLTAGGNGRVLDIKRVLVPTDLSHGLSKDFKYAIRLSNEFGASIYLLNVVEVGGYDFPLEIVEQMKGFSLREMEENIGRVNVKENIEVSVEVAENAWKGIVGFAKDKDMDLIVMMTYGGGKFKENFIGSVAEKVIQESHCPVIAMKP